MSVFFLFIPMIWLIAITCYYAITTAEPTAARFAMMILPVFAFVLGVVLLA